MAKSRLSSSSRTSMLEAKTDNDMANLRFKLRLQDPPLWINFSEDYISEPKSRSLAFVQDLSATWTPNPSLFKVPESCILATRVPEMDLSHIAESADLLINMTYIQLAPLRPWLRPLTSDDMWLDIYIKGRFCPDFYLQPHAAGASRMNNGYGLRPYPVEAAIEPTLVRILDILRSDGGLLPIVQAAQNIFSGLPTCGLRLNPAMSFPWPRGPPPASGVLEAFALVPQFVCPTLPQTMKKMLLSPATVLDPVIFLGIVDITNNNDICPEDQKILSEGIQPHLEALIIAMKLHFAKKACSDIKSPAALPEWAVIFAIIIRRGVVYVISHTPSWEECGWQFRSDVVDRIPFPLRVDTVDDLRQRMRLAMALLTLQRHACVLSTVFEDILWPPNLIDERQHIRNTHTGIRSPCPSDGLSRKSGSTPFDEYLDEKAEERRERKQLKKDIKKSKSRVKAWRKGLAARQSSPPATLAFFDIDTSTTLESVQPIFSLARICVHPSAVNSNSTNGLLDKEDWMLLPDKLSAYVISPEHALLNRDASTSSIIQILQDSAEKWFLLKARSPVRMAEKYRLGLAAVDIPEIHDPDAVRTATLKIFFRTLDDCAHLTWRFPSRVQWVNGSDTDIAPWPEPDFSFLYPSRQADGRTSSLTRTFFNLLRLPRYFEGGPEYGVDSCIKDALIHIFDLPNVVFQPMEEQNCLVPLGLDVPGWRDRVHAERLALVINFTKERPDARRALARAARPGVDHLMRKYHELNGYNADRITQHDREGSWLPMEAQPAHHFVYGIHCAEGHLSVYAHFAAVEVAADATSRSWRYHQILVQTHSTDYLPISSGGRYDWRPPTGLVMLQRWQLIVTLFTIRRHVIDLNEGGPHIGCHDPKENGS